MRRAALPALLFVLGACSRGGGLDLDAALAHAARLGRPLLLEFTSGDCEPCRRLQHETLPAPRVREWLDAHVELQPVDGDAEHALVERFRVSGFPTLVFLAQDGSELGRIVGFRDAEKLLCEAEAALAGRDALSRARARVAAHPDELGARFDLASALVESAQLDEALVELERCWERGAPRAPVEGGLYLVEFGKLARRFGPARSALVGHRDALLDALRAAAAPEPREVLLAARIDLALDDDAGLLAFYDELGARGEIARNARGLLVPLVFDALLEARRYAELLANTEDVVAAIEKRRAKLGKLPAAPSDELASRVREQAAREVERMGCAYFEALLGTGRKDEAVRVARAWLGNTPDGAQLVRLDLLARRAGRAEEGRALVLALLEQSALDEAARASVRRDLDGAPR